MSDTVAIHELLRMSRVARTAGPDPATRTPLRDRVKVVVCVVDGTPVPALLPASLVVNLERLLNLTGAGEIRLAGDDEETSLLADEPIFADVRLALSHEIVFTTDTAETAVMRWADFARTVRPIVGDFAERPRDHVAAYRLSYCE